MIRSSYRMQNCVTYSGTGWWYKVQRCWLLFILAVAPVWLRILLAAVFLFAWTLSRHASSETCWAFQLCVFAFTSCRYMKSSSKRRGSWHAVNLKDRHYNPGCINIKAKGYNKNHKLLWLDSSHVFFTRIFRVL